MKFNRIILASLLLIFSLSAGATSGVKMLTDKGGLEWWMGISTDTKPTGTTVPLGSYFIESDTKQQYRTNSAGAWVSLAELVHLTTLGACEDQTNSVCKTEMQMSYSSPKIADYQVKASPGFVHAISCEGSDGVATAGTIILYDSLTEAGSIIWQFDTFATAQYTPFTIILDNVATIGLYLGYTTVADVRCNVSYR